MSFILFLVQVRTSPDALTIISTLWMEENQQINWILIPVIITTLSSPPLFLADLLEHFPVQRCNSSGFKVWSAWVRWRTPPTVKISLLSKLLQSIHEREI